MSLVEKLLWATCVILISQQVESIADRDVKSITINHQIGFKLRSYAVVYYRLQFTKPMLQRNYKIDGRVINLDEHEWKEITEDTFTYFVVFGPVTKTHDLRIEVVTEDSTTNSTAKIIRNDYFEGKIFFTGANHGEKCGEKCPNCNETAVCVTDKSDCDQKTGTCSCRQGYQWESNICKYNLTDVKYGEKCNSTTKCVTLLSQCDSKKGLCDCRRGYYWEPPICSKSAKHGDKCKSTAACVTKDTECDPKTKLCECRQGYHWDSATSICKNGVMGMLVVRQEGIAMLVLAILLTIIGTTSTAGL